MAVSIEALDGFLNEHNYSTNYETNGTTMVAYTDFNSSTNFTGNDSDFNEKRYLEKYLGERHMATWSLVLLNFIYIAIFLTGLFGNVCTCVVIARNRYMHTATNYYLLSLAVSDLILLVLALPPELYTFWEAYPWRLGNWFCILKAFIQEMTSNVSVLTIAAFTIERYLAICHPMTSQIVSSPSRAVKLLIIQWIAASVCALPYPIHAKTFHALQHPSTGAPLETSLVCTIPPENTESMTYWFHVSTFVFFVYPMSVITVMYILIGYRLQRSDLVGDRNNIATVRARKAVVKMLVAVVVAFFVCWAPFHAQRLMTIYIGPDDWTPRLIHEQTILFHISGVLYFVSSTVNPLLYNAMSKKYRRAFMKTIFPCVSGQHRDLISGSHYHSHMNSGVTKTSSPYFYNKLFTRQTTRMSSVNDQDSPL